MWFGTFTRTCTTARGMVVWTWHLQGRQLLPWERSPVNFEQIGLGVVFQGKSWDKGPSSLALPRMVHNAWPVAPDVISHIYSHLYFSLRDGGRDLSSSGEAALTMGQVPCEFWADRPNFIFQPVAPNVIWHIYSHLYCSSRDGSRDSPSSEEAVPTMGQVPCEFPADQPTFIFQLVAPDMIWHIYSGQHCFKGVLGMDLLSSGDVNLTMGQVQCELQAYWPTFIFQLAALDMLWHIYSRQCCLTGDGAIHLLSSGEVILGLGKVPCKSPGECNILWRWEVRTFNPAHSKCAESHQEPLAKKWRLTDLLETHKGPAPSWGHHPLKTACPYLKPPWNSAAQSKCAKSHQEPPAEKWSLANLLKTHSGPAPW